MTAPPLLLALHSCSDCFGMALLDPQQPRARAPGAGSSGWPGPLQQLDFAGSGAPPARALAPVAGPCRRDGTRRLHRHPPHGGDGPHPGATAGLPPAGGEQLCPDGPTPGAATAPIHAGGTVLDHPGVPRRGVVGGQYRITAGQVHELSLPTLLPQGASPKPAVEVQLDVEADVARLLQLLQRSHAAGAAMPWAEVLPIYPTSPVGQV